jgi:hypothetical protein
VTTATGEFILLGAYREGALPARVVPSNQFAPHVSFPRAVDKYGACVPAELLDTADLRNFRENP